jgi:hypothetical protein
MSLIMINNPKMVVIWGGENILLSSIQYLLANRNDWIVVSVSSAEEFETQVLIAKKDLSDIVLIYQGDMDEPCDLPMQLLHDHAELRVITISLENNVMNVYNKQSLLVKETADLVSVIETVA